MAFKKYQRTAVIVGAQQAYTGGDYGVLGTLISTDYIIKLASGTIVTEDATTFEAKYSLTNDNATLVGADIYWE